MESSLMPSRLAKLISGLGADVDNWPLSAYRSRSHYTMRTDRSTGSVRGSNTG